MTPGSVREECFLRSEPSLSSRLVAVDGAGLARFVEVVFSRGAHHVAPRHILLLLPDELLAHLGGDVHPGLPARAAGPDGVESESYRGVSVVLPGATDRHVVTE